MRCLQHPRLPPIVARGLGGHCFNLVDIGIRPPSTECLPCIPARPVSTVWTTFRTTGPSYAFGCDAFGCDAPLGDVLPVSGAAGLSTGHVLCRMHRQALASCVFQSGQGFGTVASASCGNAVLGAWVGAGTPRARTCGRALRWVGASGADHDRMGLHAGPAEFPAVGSHPLPGLAPCMRHNRNPAPLRWHFTTIDTRMKRCRHYPLTWSPPGTKVRHEAPLARSRFFLSKGGSANVDADQGGTTVECGQLKPCRINFESGGSRKSYRL